MPFTHKSASYAPLPVKNPFNDSGDRAYGELLFIEQGRSKFYLRVFGFGSLALFAVTIYLFWYAVSLQRTVPILVNVMPSGEAAYLGEVKDTGRFEIPEAAVFWQVRSFVSNVRSIPADPYVLDNNIRVCYSMITTNYDRIFTATLRASSPYPMVGKVRRSVEFESTLHITGSSYQVDWVEFSVESGSSSVSSRKMRGLLTIMFIAPSPSAPWVKDNPLGIFIDAFDWTEI